MRWLLISLSILALAGCTGELIENSGGTGGPGLPDAGGGTGVQARADFEANVVPLLTATKPKGACVTCHQAGGMGVDFLGLTPADNYDTLTANPGLVGATPAASRFLTRGDHDGNAWCTGAGAPYAECTIDESTIVSNWLTLQASGL